MSYLQMDRSRDIIFFCSTLLLSYLGAYITHRPQVCYAIRCGVHPTWLTSDAGPHTLNEPLASGRDEERATVVQKTHFFLYTVRFLSIVNILSAGTDSSDIML